MVQLSSICEYLEQFAPVRLAEDWDNVGLLVGDENAAVDRVMTCLTITPSSAAEAIERGAQLIITHHPMPFRPVKRITTDSTVGRLLWDLARAGIAIYSPHTAFDSATAGINQRLAEGLGLVNIVPLAPLPDDVEGLGAGRRGSLSAEARIAEFADTIKAFLNVEGLHVVGDPDSQIKFPAVACGSAGQFLEAAGNAGCDALVTGETSFHTCLEAEARGIALFLPGHFASERFAVVELADTIREQFPSLQIWASEQEKDPLAWH